MSIKSVDPPGQQWKKYHGINNSELQVTGEVSAKITLDGETKTIKMGVVEGNTMVTPVLLGRDTLKQFGYGLTKSPRFDSAVSDIMQVELGENNAFDKTFVNKDIPQEYRDRIREIFNRHYEEPERPDTPKDKVEARITLKDSQPVHFGPRRLAYSDKKND